MKQEHTATQLITVFALSLPDIPLRPLVAGLTKERFDDFHQPLSQAITSARKRGLAQILADPPREDSTADHKKAIQQNLRGILDALQLPGETIELKLNWTEQGPVVINLRSKVETRTTLTDLPEERETDVPIEERPTERNPRVERTEVQEVFASPDPAAFRKPDASDKPAPAHTGTGWDIVND